MNDRINKTSICSIVFLDIIDYSKTPVSEQYEVKNQFNAFINHALKGVAQNDRIIIDTGDGAAIAYMGSPEDALFMALSIRDDILKGNENSKMPMLVRFGINLGPVRVVKDINGQPNIIGDGINVAQRIMSFAKPNQILVSRSYYEVTSRLTQEISKMFDYSGVKHDKHVREHEVYSVKLDGEQALAAALHEATDLGNTESAMLLSRVKKINWKYAASGLAAVLVLFSVVKFASAPSSAPAINISQPALAAEATPPSTDLKLSKKTVETPAKALKEPVKQASVKQASQDTRQDKPIAQEKTAEEKAVDAKRAQEKAAQDQLAQDKLAEARLAKKKSKQLAMQKAKAEAKSEPAPVATPTHTEVAHSATTSTHTSKPAPEKASEKSDSISMQPVLQHVCTQAERMMNTCH